jgi:hypothetical protein
MQWLELAPPTHPFRQRALCLLVKLSATSGELPRSLFVDDVHISDSRDPIFHGGCADIFRGTRRGLLVAVKRPRVTDVASNPRAVSRYWPATMTNETYWIEASLSGSVGLAPAKAPARSAVHRHRCPHFPFYRACCNRHPVARTRHTAELYEVECVSTQH